MTPGTVSSRATIDAATDFGDDTADLFAEVFRRHDEDLWHLESHS